MDLENVKKVINAYADVHAMYLKDALTAERYYKNETDILFEPSKAREQAEKDKDGELVTHEIASPMRNADNRIPFNFHGLLVNQKASYMFTAPPMFDIGSDAANKSLNAFLGDKYPKVCKDLCVEASNKKTGWIHVWKSAEDGAFHYAVVPSEQIQPIWSKSLDRKLLGVLRIYHDVDDTGDEFDVYEIWNDKECSMYKVPAGRTVNDGLMPYNNFILVDAGVNRETNTYQHGMGEVPFFAFDNNNIHTDDLKNIKPLIDVYCKVFSGFVNDLEDIQEVIFVLTNYGGADLTEFLSDLKYYKTIKVENDGDGDNSGVSTLTIDLPVEAREKLLTITRKCIFEQGMGIDPDPQNFGNSSGVALKFLYSLLELKSGLMETEFKPSFGRFIRCVCRVLNITIKDDAVVQTWIRTMVQNDQEMAQIAQQSSGIISNETIVRNHPWVENVQDELDKLAEEKAAAQEEMMQQYDPFGNQQKKQDTDDPDDPDADQDDKKGKNDS
jgi:SPP1 family phage portal protein